MKLMDEDIVKALRAGKGVRSIEQFSTTWVLKCDGLDAFKIERIDYDDTVISVGYVLSIDDLIVDDWGIIE